MSYFVYSRSFKTFWASFLLWYVFISIPVSCNDNSNFLYFFFFFFFEWRPSVYGWMDGWIGRTDARIIDYTKRA